MSFTPHSQADRGGGQGHGHILASPGLKEGGQSSGTALREIQEALAPHLALLSFVGLTLPLSQSLWSNSLFDPLSLLWPLSPGPALACGSFPSGTRTGVASYGFSSVPLYWALLF